jgi:hypothetical protein
MDFVQDIIIPSYALQTPSYLYVCPRDRNLAIGRFLTCACCHTVTRPSDCGCGNTRKEMVRIVLLLPDGLW